MQQLRAAFPEAGRTGMSFSTASRHSAPTSLSSCDQQAKAEAHKCAGSLANGLAERSIGSCRRELLDHVIALAERHLLRLIHEYGIYYHEHRIHDLLEKDAPIHRAIEREARFFCDRDLHGPARRASTIGTSGARRHRTRALLNGSTPDLVEALESPNVRNQVWVHGRFFSSLFRSFAVAIRLCLSMTGQ